MAYANNTVFEILDNIFGYDDESLENKIDKIVKSLKSGKDVESETYYGLKKKLDDKGMKQYLKYVYMYLDDFIKSATKQKKEVKMTSFFIGYNYKNEKAYH